MKKTTKIVIVVLLVVIAGVVGVFAVMRGKARQESRDTAPTAVQKVLMRDLSTNYPATPKEVIKYYTEIERCFYAEETTAEELEELGMKARELYDAGLLAINEEESYLADLKADVERFHDKKRVIVSAAVASSVNVFFFQEDGYDFARLNCVYKISENGNSMSVDVVYLLRRNENRLWKIYGWDNAANLHIQQLAE